MRIVLSPELTEEETFFIGKIMAQWGAIEYEIFAQTLGTFEGHTLDQLPKEVNNLQFSGMLRLWRERVAEKAGGERGAVLLRQADALVALQDYRNALIHGMWEWGTNGTPHDLSVIRIAKHQIKKTSFPAGSLRDFCERVEDINFGIRFPGGDDEYFQHLGKIGHHMSRSFVQAIYGDPAEGKN